MSRYYLTAADVIDIHDLQIKVFGGADGLRDKGALESALFRPQSGYYSDIIQEASALWESLSQNHPFVDGNKRTALVSTVSFLRYNGVVVPPLDKSALEFVKRRYEGKGFTLEAAEIWLRANTRAE